MTHTLSTSFNTNDLFSRVVDTIMCVLVFSPETVFYISVLLSIVLL